MHPLNILLVVQYEIVRDGIKQILEEASGIAAVEAVKTIKQLESLEPENDIGIIVLDLDIPCLDNSEKIKELVDRHSDIRFLAISDNRPGKKIREIMKTGVHGYIFKKQGAEEIIKAVKQINEGKQYLCDDTIGMLLDKDPMPEKGHNATSLTDREHEVLQLICQELTNREAAEELGISVRTVDAHRRNLLQKTGAKNTAGLVKFAIKHHLIDL